MTDQQQLTPATSISNETALSLTLQTVGPKAGATAGAPVESYTSLYEDDKLDVGVWECTPGSFPSAKDGIDEVMYFIAGRGRIVSADGSEHLLEPGATVVAPNGWQGTWHIEETVRKIYVITTVSE